METITESKQKLSKKEQIIAYHGIYRATTIARKIKCSRVYVYIVWKNCGLDVDYNLTD